MRVGDGRRAAVVGAGPSGFYASDQLLSLGFEVDLYDRLPTPFGLVRAGVAPDHPKIKSVTRVYEKTATHEGFRFFGGVAVGRDVSCADLRERYHAVLYAVGSASDKRLDIPGEGRPGSYAATRFVAWYNGHPHATQETFDLSARRAVVIGNGNVALDLARILVLDPRELALTDVADHALAALAAARVQEVVVLGRRGPAQAAFTNPELRELRELSRAAPAVEPGDVELDDLSRAWLEDEADPTARRNYELLREFSQAPHADDSRRITFKFLRSPLEVLGEGSDGPVTGIRVGINRIERGPGGTLAAVPTGTEEAISCGLVIRSIGYRALALGDLPFDDARGLIRNVGGRVSSADGIPHRGEYVVGWAKRGASGVIGTNKKDAADTVAKIAEDAAADGLLQPGAAGRRGNIERWLREAVADLVDWEGWRAIDLHELTLGAPKGRPRVKLVTTHELVGVGRAAGLRAKDAVTEDI